MHNFIFLFFVLISMLFSHTLVSQTVPFLDESENYKAKLEPFDMNAQTCLFNDKYSLKINSVTNGGPFNNNDNPQIDSVIIKMADSPIDSIRYYYAYDSLGNVASETKQNNYRVFYEYNSYGNIVSELWQFWVNDQWVNDTFITNNYDSTGREILYLNQKWSNSIWVNSSRVKFFYNLAGKLDSNILEDWNGNAWVNSYKSTYTYNENNQLVQRLILNWEENSWVEYYRYTYAYDSIGNLITYITEVFSDNGWNKLARWRNVFNEDNYRIIEYYDTYENDDWKENTKTSFSYNEDWKIIYHLVEIFDSDRWVNQYQTFRTYNEEGYFSYSRNERWEENNNVWVPGNVGIYIYDNAGNRRRYYGAEIKVYYNDETNDVDTDSFSQKDFYLSQNYPNPFNPRTTIAYVIPNVETQNFASLQNITLKIYDVLGREVATLVNQKQTPGKYSVQFNAISATGGLPSGVYFYTLRAGNFVQTRKMILMK